MIHTEMKTVARSTHIFMYIPIVALFNVSYIYMQIYLLMLTMWTLQSSDKPMSQTWLSL